MPQIKKLRRLEETTLRLGGSGDNWHMSWADNDRQYVSLCDGAGLPGTPAGSYNSRLYAACGDPPEVKFEFLPTYPELTGPARYYNFGILALDGRIYSYLSTHRGAWPSEFGGAKLIYSPDGGQTWCNQDGTTPVRWEQGSDRSRQHLLFFEESGDAFSLLTVLQMGRNYQANTDGYVYLYAPNGSVEGSMNQLVLCRVAKDRILDRRAYEFFAGRRAAGGAAWSQRIEDRGVVHTFPAGWVNQKDHPYAWHPSVVFYATTGQYLMANWGMGCTPDGSYWFGKPSYLGFWTAPQPWGPWTLVHEETAWTPAGEPAARAYQPQIAPKWISSDGSTFWLVWTDFQVIDNQRPYYAFNLQQVAVELG